MLNKNDYKYNKSIKIIANFVIKENIVKGIDWRVMQRLSDTSDVSLLLCESIDRI